MNSTCFKKKSTFQSLFAKIGVSLLTEFGT